MDAAALADASSLDAFVLALEARHVLRLRRPALNTVFQNDRDFMAWPRDSPDASVSRLPWVRGRALDVLSGRASGLFTSIDT